jgi:hypothetical protein
MNEELEKLLDLIEGALWSLSQDYTGEAKSEIDYLRTQVEASSALTPDAQSRGLKHLDEAFVALRTNYDTRIASWHLWKLHRSIRGRW